MFRCIFKCERKIKPVTFTIVYVHVVSSTSAHALRSADEFALTLVKEFFRKYTEVDLELLERHKGKFKGLICDSRIELAFKGKLKGFACPSYKIYTHNNAYGTVIFDVETRILKRHIDPGCTYETLEIERTDFLYDYASGEIILQQKVGTPEGKRVSTYPSASSGYVKPKSVSREVR